MRRNQLPTPVFLLLFLLLPRDATTASAKPQYVVLVPSELYAGVPEKVCVHLNHLNETVTLNITLEYGTQHSNLLTGQAVDKDSFYCSSFTVSGSPSPSAFIAVEIKGPTHHFIKKKSMRITKTENPVFVQTDKPIYKPGQTVKFRVVSVDIGFRPVNETFPVVYIESPKRNRIFQWQNVNLPGGLHQLSFPLSVEPALGIYKVVVQKVSGKKIEHSFEVKEYVLPKFEVQVKMPKTMAFLEEELVVTACGSYTYGKPVPGLVTIKVCRKYTQYHSNCHGPNSKSICEEFSKQADDKGCFRQVVKTKVFQPRQKGYDMKIEAEAKIKEDGTGTELTGTGSCEITNTLSKLKFTKANTHYRPGLPFFGQVLLVDEKDQPIPNKNVTVLVNPVGSRSTFTTDEHGLANILIDTTNFTFTFLRTTVTYKGSNICYDNWWLDEYHTQADHSATRIFSPSRSYVQLELVLGTLACGQTQEIRIHYLLNEDTLKDEKDLTFYYVIKARGSIFNSGSHVLSLEQGNTKGVFSFPIQVEPGMAPVAQLLVYTILPNEELIADAQEFDIEKCFANVVDLSFPSAQSLPASDTHLKVKATPLSLCALTAVDQSVLLLKPEAKLSPQSIYSLLPQKADQGSYFGTPMYDDSEKNCINAEDITHNGIVYTPKQDLNDNDAYSIFQSIGLNIFTNSRVRKPHYCSPYRPYSALAYVGAGAPQGLAMAATPGGSFRSSRLRPTMMMMGASEEPQAVEVRETVRKFFPDTWIWNLMPLDLSGDGELPVKVPDTITEWKASAFCLSGTTGLGLSSAVTLQAFQPFFLELTLPYSVVRGEAFTLKATVLNYMPHCIRIHVGLEISPDFLAVPVGDHEDSHCICGNERKTVSWAVTPKSLGEVNFTATAEALQSPELCGNKVTEVPALVQKDTVVKPVIVEPEGIEKEQTYNTLLCPQDAELQDNWALDLPPNVVEGSARATQSVLGDILGSAMQNLQNLLQMPYGCGEQNMVLFVPNIYVLDYLNETQQLTEAIKTKALGYLTSGYQRQLNYQHSDGSYSTFGDHGMRNSQGNTWLTAFVLKAFSQAQSYIYIEKTHITNAFNWLSMKQKENGCFQQSGSLLNNAMKGGVDDEVTLSAYITIALLEMPLPVTHSVVRNALFCLETAWASISNSQESHVYTKALLAYAFALAGNRAKRNELLESLNKDAVNEEESVHWRRPTNVQENVPEMRAFSYKPRAPSAEVEMTSYVLLAYLTSGSSRSTRDLSSSDLSTASKIVKWISKQQNSHGGFSSTQDTVVALQALSKYGAATFTKSNKEVSVTIESSGTFSQIFHVNNGNRLLLQEVRLPNLPGNYVSKVSGSGCVYLQTSLKYNILPEAEGKAPFTLKVNTLPLNLDKAEEHRKFQIHINVSYIGERPSSNMVIVDVKMVSGFIPVKPSVKKLQDKPNIQRTEVNTNHVLIYIEKLTNQTMAFSFVVEQDIPVRNLKPAPVKVYDYYETDEFTIEEYSAPFSSDSEQGNA